MAPGMEIGYVVTDATKREVDIEEMPRNSILDIMESCWRMLGTRSPSFSRILAVYKCII